MRSFRTGPACVKAAVAPWKTFAVSACAAALAVFAQPAEAAGISNLYSFCQLGGCQDGAGPNGGLVADAQGNLFGVAVSGGNVNSAGVIYEIVRHPRRGTARYRSLHEFCASPSCTDGRNPAGRLVIDGAGRLYGTAQGGGDVNSGVAFMLSPPQPGHSKWSYAVLQSFCSGHPTCVAGAMPQSGLTYAGAYTGVPYDGTSPLYGVASRGGRYGYGTVYSLRHQRDWKLRALYAFCPDTGTCAGGAAPVYAPVLDGAGNLYGITSGGGGQNAGVVFKLSPGSGNAYSVVHDFCSSPDCADGASPSDLIVDAGGNLFGTASLGGAISHPFCSTGCGTLFKIASDETFSVLYAFCARTPLRCTDGSDPSGITLTPSGDIYGVTSLGGKARQGTIFRMAAALHTLFSFCPEDDCSAGANPVAAPLQDGAGKFFGVAAGGGNSRGTVYEFTR